MREQELRKEFNNWCDMWATAQESEDFQNAPKAPQPNPHRDQEYWTQVHSRMMHPDDAPDLADPNVLNEREGDVEMPTPVKQQLSDKEVADVVKAKLNTANPVQASSLGKDQDYKPSLADVYQLEQLHDMKANLQELECKLNTKTAFGQSKEGQKIQSQIDELRKKIDDLSDSLTPSFLQSYLS